MSKLFNITIIEPSAIICQGITGIISNSGINNKTTIAENLRRFEETSIIKQPDAVFINPVIIQNQDKEFQVIRRKFPQTHWIGIVYSLTDQHLLSMFDEIIFINDPPSKIISSLQKKLSTNTLKPAHENLTEREIDVLKLLVAGNANKEIAEKLNISTHTVITHRKNISQKTGIKSVSGLTIYAVLKELVSVNDYLG